jgi:hypothetical protein
MRVFALGVLIGGALVWALMQQSTATVAVAERATGTPAALPTGADAALAQAKRSGKSVPVTLVYTERQLTDAAVAGMPRAYQGINLSDPRVQLQPGVVVFTAQAQWGFVSGTLTALSTAGVADGRAVISVTSAAIAGISLPDAIRRSIETELQRQLDLAVPSNLTVTGIAVTPGVLTVQAIANP